MKKKLLSAAVLLSAVSLFSGCATVTIAGKGEQKYSGTPTQEQTHDFYFWGLAGEHTVDVSTICNGETPKQMQTQYTGKNVLFGVITLGIYAPRSSKIWC